MDKTEIVNKIRSLTEELRNAKAQLDEFNQKMRDEYEKKKFQEYTYRAGDYSTIKPEEFPIYKRGTEEAGFCINKWGLVEHGVGYYGGGASCSVARSLEEGKKRVFFDQVADYILKVNQTASKNRQQSKDAPYVELDLDKIVENLYKVFSEASLAGVFDNIQFETAVLDDNQSSSSSSSS